MFALRTVWLRGVDDDVYLKFRLIEFSDMSQMS